MGQRNFSGSIALTKLVHVMMKKKNKEGKEIEGIFIPVDLNHITVVEKDKKKSAYLAVRVVAKDEEDEYKQHGFIAHSVDSKTYKDATDEQKEEFKKLPILGNIKDFSGGSSNDNSGAASDVVIDAEADDLPF